MKILWNPRICLPWNRHIIVDTDRLIRAFFVQRFHVRLRA